MVALVIALLVALYLAVGFIVALIHYISPGRKDPSWLKWVFLAPYAGALWLAKRISQ